MRHKCAYRIWKYNGAIRAQNNIRRQKMKNSILIGAMLGIVTATALYCSTSNTSLKKAKRALVNKIEDIIL